jgi:hypothetical protein
MGESRDGGRSFDPAQKLGQGSWKLSACPMDGGGLIASAGNTFQTTWQRNGRIYFCQMSQPEQFIAPGRQPAIDQHRIAFTDSSDTLSFVSLAKMSAVRTSFKAADPSLASDAQHSICTWEWQGRSYVQTEIFHDVSTTTKPSP